jgi:interleukin-1 receptor-associated kinase 1
MPYPVFLLHQANMDLLFVFLLLLLPDVAFSTSTAACNRRCGDASPVPYPFGFTAGCPIALSCDATTSTPNLPYRGGNNASYRVLAFNSTASTVVLSLPSSCNRSILDAKRALSGGNYAVSSRTGLFLRGGCGETNSTGCTVAAPVMSNLLRTAQCVENVTASAAGDVACVISSSPNTTSAGVFLSWEKAEYTTCDEVLTSVLIAETPEGTESMEFGLAELGWWLNGTCANEPCAANATCSDVTTPSGATGHRCACVTGMCGDGFSAGDGCYLKGESW